MTKRAWLMMFVRAALCAIPLLGLVTTGAQADVIPYPFPWFQNWVTYTLKAATSGDVTAYFVESQAGFTEDVGLYDVTTGQQIGGMGLPNHDTATGTMFDFGRVSAGDELALFIIIESDYTPPPNETGLKLWSLSSRNADGANHVYAAAFQGNGLIPSGVYVGFEDLLADNYTDWNYTDEQFVLTNAIAYSNYGEVFTAVPEPTASSIMASGLIGLMAARRHRRFG